MTEDASDGRSTLMNIAGVGLSGAGGREAASGAVGIEPGVGGASARSTTLAIREASSGVHPDSGLTGDSCGSTGGSSVGCRNA
jgi:hypothetical protein